MKNRSSAFTVQSSGIRNTQPAIWDPNGFTYLALLAAILILGITLGAAGKSWQAIATRDREAELLFRGGQYRQAIESYFLYQGKRQYPPSIGDLLKDSRSPAGKRHLRRRFPDPMTGKDFVEVRDQVSRRIVGVHSASDKEPVQQKNFPDIYGEFDGKTKYSEWIFTYTTPLQKPVQTRVQTPVKQP